MKRITSILTIAAMAMVMPMQALASPSTASAGSAERAVEGTPRASDGLAEQNSGMAPAQTANGFQAQPGVTVHYLGNTRERLGHQVGSIYLDVNDATDLVAQTLDDATRHLLVLGEDAPAEHRFRVSADGPIELRMSDEGGVHVIARGVTIEEEELPDEVVALGLDYGALDPSELELAYIEAPWAFDADGNAVPTSYEVRGQTVVQTVEHQGAAYPVVADPTYTCGWTNCTVWYNRSETREIVRYGWLTG